MEAPRSARPMLGDASTPNACGELSFRSRCNGGYGDLLTDDDLKTERATEPPKRWRNWWRARSTCSIDMRTMTTMACRPGDVIPGDTVWPSKDAAETAARRAIEASASPDEYLGAFPDGEAP